MNIIRKIKTKAWALIIKSFRKSRIYPFLYRASWHLLFHKEQKKDIVHNYLAARPNSFAGIGHQMANWIAGYWFAQKFNLNFAHMPFASDRWEKLLGFGINELSVEDLSKKGFKTVRLPRFDEDNEKEIRWIRRIISSYKSKVIFICEQDQFYREQFGVMDVLKRKFYNTKTKESHNLIYNDSTFNIAVHIRRGDIVVNKKPNNINLSNRFQDISYFINTLKLAIAKLNKTKRISIFLFSQGVKSDFSAFEEFENVSYCLDMGAEESFLHMVYADVLITSKSSFSYKPALLSNGLKFVPDGFWHGYPETPDWVVIK